MNTTTFTSAEAAALGGFIGALVLPLFIIMLIMFILMVIADWRIFEKAGEKGWKSLIPIYNTYIMYKIVNMKSWFWYLIAVNIITYLMFLFDGVNIYSLDSFDVINFAAHPSASVASIFSSIICLIASIIYVHRTAKVFGKGDGFAVGLFFLPNLFWLILAFGKAKYNKKNLSK